MPQGCPIQLRYFDPKQEAREIRISTATHDVGEAQQHKKDLEAKLRLGIDPKPKATVKRGPEMDWQAFRLEYSRLHLDGLRDKTSIDSESRLDIAERIIKPRTLADLADSPRTQSIAAGTLEGSRESVRPAAAALGSQRSLAHGVGSRRTQLGGPARMARKGSSIPKVKTSKLRCGRAVRSPGRNSTDAGQVPGVVGAGAAPSWKYLLRGLWTLRSASTN